MQTNPLLRESDSGHTLHSAASALEDVAGQMLGIDDEEPDQDEPDDEPAEDREAEADAPEESDEADESPEEPESIALETLDDVAKALGVDPTDLMANLKMRIKVNGEEQLISLAEAQKGNQFEKDYRLKTSALADERRVMQAEREFQTRQVTEAATQAAAAMRYTEQVLLAEANSPQMHALRTENPGEWTARNQEFQYRLSSLNNARAEAAQQFTQVIQQQQQQAEAEKQSVLQRESDALRSRIPDWNQDRAQEAAKVLSEQYGFTEEELNNVYDHRLILLAVDAANGRKVTAETQKALKPVKATPKLMAAGKPKSPLSVKSKTIAALRSNLRSTGKVRDAAKLIETLL